MSILSTGASQLPCQVASEPYSDQNLLDRISRKSTLEFFYRHLEHREQDLLRRRSPIKSGRVLSVGCGVNPGRHLFPAPQFCLVGVDANPDYVRAVESAASADEVLVGYAGQLELAPETFDIVLYRFVLHHIAFRQPLDDCFAEAARLLRRGGVLVAVEPGLWHPVGLGLSLANRAGLGVRAHGTPDDIPLSPRRLISTARKAGFAPELHAVTYAWRRLSPEIQRAFRNFDSLGSRPRAAALGHTLMLVARKL